MSRITDKQGQLKNAETIAAMFIFILLLMMGLVSYMKYKQGTFKEKLDELNQKLATETAIAISTLPELKCVRDDTEDSSCVDKYKLESFLKVISSSSQNTLIYDSIFGNSVVKMIIVFPESQKREWLIYNKTFEHNQYGVYSTLYPVTVYDPVTFKRTFGYLDIKVHVGAQ